MQVAVLGTGTVGRTLAAAVAAAGHSVAIGTRDVPELLEREGEGAFRPWAEGHPDVTVATFDDAARHGELVVNATAGGASLRALDLAGAQHLADKILVDVANPLDFSQGFPPSLTVANTDSLAEQIQRAFPRTKVVKALNMVNASVMVDPASVAGGQHDALICGDDEDAKAAVADALRDWFGWRSVLDLGDLSAARGMEAYLLLWVRLMGALGTATFNLKLLR